MVDYAGLRWYDPPTTGNLGFWDFAGASRYLRSACFQLSCAHSHDHNHDHHDQDSELRGQCFHTQSLELLDWLQRKAWGEIRSKILRIVGDRLPAELAERIFECALDTEGVPLRLTAKERYLAHSPDYHPDRYKKTRMLARTKQEYIGHCRRVQEPEPNWISIGNGLTDSESDSET